MDTISINTKLYFLLTHADGQVHTKEVEMGEKMMWHEAINKDKFNSDIEFLSKQNPDVIFDECVEKLTGFNRNDQINCLAWMCLIANSDGFMDKNEWQLIYRIYHKHLALELNEIMQRQKELNRFISQYRTAPEPKKDTSAMRPSSDTMAFPL